MKEPTQKQLEILNKLPEDIREKLLSTARPSIKLHLTPTEGLPLTTSKIGGYGYLPHNIEYPKNENGVPLGLLAQINFEEFEHLEDYPESGLLAIYIDVTDEEFYGCEFELLEGKSKKGYQVFYFDSLETESHTVEKQKVYFSDILNEPDFNPPVQKECKITGKLMMSFPTPNCIELLNMLGLEDIEGEAYELDFVVSDEFYAMRNALVELEGEKFPQHRIGGYPSFTQVDPRNDNSDYDTLLFSLATQYSDVEMEEFLVIWGDIGMANFFINRNKLKQRDFSDVLYYWDCG